MRRKNEIIIRSLADLYRAFPANTEVKTQAAKEHITNAKPFEMVEVSTGIKSGDKIQFESVART